jgi:hypothetical protein
MFVKLLRVSLFCMIHLLFIDVSFPFMDGFDGFIASQDLTARHVGLDKESISGMTSVKLLAPYYYSAIAALNRSNPFGLSIMAEPPWPDSWSASFAQPLHEPSTDGSASGFPRKWFIHHL